ncbi:Protein of unknown function [Cognatiyoonia sediminum]|uniref:DUF3445 domain-containing protein n=1 Tax=Cognatiyoonia sediminum TaxID=1508389 RepID=A0A1M5RYR9_9RHOB|nr:DUF3445 domain-containing protein [Cognatiyoonia sediminum]SHH31375.1 Protein of unknown function [Cognatiyoonia sediminum]
MATKPVLQNQLDPNQRSVAARSLPGMQPLRGVDWITVDEAYSTQLAEKARLLATKEDAVLRCLPDAQEPAREVLSEVLQLLRDRTDFEVRYQHVICPDKTRIDLNFELPLQTLSKLIQEDICILQKIGDEHVLTAALLCFPASWTLAEKIGKPLIAIHRPVPEYDTNIAKRVQRLFDGVRVGQPMWRANFLNYSDPALHHPRTEAEPRTDDHMAGTYERSERQTVWRLPKTGAVVFSVHTTITKPNS